MENTNRKKIIKIIETVYEKAQGCKLHDSFFEEINDELQVLSKFFEVSERQAFLIAIVFSNNYMRESATPAQLGNEFSCNPLKVLEFQNDFEFLCKKGFFKRFSPLSEEGTAGSTDKFVVQERITNLLQDWQIDQSINGNTFKEIVELLEKIYEIAIQRYRGRITTIELFQETESIITKNTHFPLIERIKQFDLEACSAYLYLYLIWQTLSGEDEAPLICMILDWIYDNAVERIKLRQLLLSGKNILIKKNLIEIVRNSIFSKEGMKLTDTSFQLLMECGINIFQTPTPSSNHDKPKQVITPLEIAKQELIFDVKEMQQISTLQNILKEENFGKIKNRIAERNLPKGITILLHGAPGTGKTEIAKQLAKDTEREIMKVEISEAKWIWFGESEGIIKRIFTDYASYVKDCKLTPILMFNVADALISKRKEVGSSLVDQTENAIQNIILEELESFEGILIATTNSVVNFNKAFERRFLYKIQFPKPTSAIQKRIWKSKLPELEDLACELLAQKFNFSGGQINNVKCKIEIDEILWSTSCAFEKIISFCREEEI